MFVLPPSAGLLAAERGWRASILAKLCNSGAALVSMRGSSACRVVCPIRYSLRAPRCSRERSPSGRTRHSGDLVSVDGRAGPGLGPSAALVATFRRRPARGRRIGGPTPGPARSSHPERLAGSRVLLDRLLKWPECMPDFAEGRGGSLHVVPG